MTTPPLPDPGQPSSREGRGALTPELDEGRSWWQRARQAEAGQAVEGAVHQLLNGLTVIDLQLRMVRRVTSLERAQAHLALIGEASQRVRHLVELLDRFSQTGRGRRPSELGEALLDTVALLGPGLTRGGIEILGPPEEAWIDLPSGDLMQILASLLRLARRALQATGEGGSLEILGHREGDRVTIVTLPRPRADGPQRRPRPEDGSPGPGSEEGLLAWLAAQAGGEATPEGEGWQVHLPAGLPPS